MTLETDRRVVLKKGMLFADREQCTHYIQDLALAQNKRAVVDKTKSGGRNIVYRCSSQTQCTFFVKVLQSRKSSVNGYFVSSFDIEHRGCTGSARVTARQVIELRVAKTAVAADATASARTLQDQIRSVDAIAVPTRMVYRAKEQIVEEARGDYPVEFKKVESLLEQFCVQNPASRFAFETNANQEFKRAFLSHPFVRRHEKHGQAVYGIDGAHMKHQIYREVMLVLVGRDGNNANIVLAVALCGTEDEDNCAWFIKNCKSAGINFTDRPVFSDRGRGLCAGIQNEASEAIVRFCTRHIIGNVKRNFAGSIPADIESVVYRLQAAVTPDEFKSVLFTLQMTHPQVAEYLGEIPAEKWALYPDEVQGVKFYGWRTTNFVESVNGAAIPARFKFPYQFFRIFMDQFMTNAYNSQQSGERWKSEGRLVTPYADKMLEQQRLQAGFYAALPCTKDKVFVRDTRGYQVQRRVDLAERTCTCTYMRQYGLACRHYVAALIATKRMNEMYDCCDNCYKIDNYLEGYGCGNGGIDLVLEDKVEVRDVKPPMRTIQGPGRKKTKRIPSAGEETTAKKPRFCSICRKSDHNRRTCTER